MDKRRGVVFVRESTANARWVRRLSFTANGIGLLVALAGAAYLAAWFSGYMTERGLSAITMKANAALGLLATGVALVLLVPAETRRGRRFAGRSLALLAVLLGVLTLSENLIGWDLKIDQLLATETRGALSTFRANEMGIPASASLLFAGLSLLSLSRGTRGSTVMGQALALAVCLISLLACIGHLYGAQTFYSITRLTAIAWPTAAATLALGLGLLCARPAEGVMAQVTADDPGGANLRRWLPVMWAPIALGWLRLEGERHGIFDAATGTAIIMIIFVVVLSVLAYLGARSVSRSSSALWHSGERLRLSQEAAGIGTFDWNVRTGVNVWTPELEAMYGLPAGGFAKSQADWKTLVHPEDRAEALRKVDASLRTGEPVEGEWRVIWPDGSLHWISGRWRAFKDNYGKPVRIIGVNIDITEQKRAEEALQSTIRDLERSNRELEQFAYICAHDLQEPLRQVRAFVQMLKNRYGHKLDSQAAEYLGYVYSGAVRMSDLVTGLLDYSRVGPAEAPLPKTMCQEILDAALSNLQSSIGESGARITHDALPAVIADTTQLTQLFQNLIGNAIKFRRDSVVPEIHIGCRRDGRAWVFSVKDNGIGIADEFHEKVFRIFQRLHGQEKYRGTGIGLAICKKIVDGHDGKIWIEPASGEGSTFCFTLPNGGKDD